MRATAAFCSASRSRSDSFYEMPHQVVNHGREETMSVQEFQDPDPHAAQLKRPELRHRLWQWWIEIVYRWFPLFGCCIVMNFCGYIVALITQTHPAWSVQWHYAVFGLLAGVISRISIWGRPTHADHTFRAIIFTSLATGAAAILTDILFFLLSGVAPWLIPGSILANVPGLSILTACTIGTGTLSALIWIIHERSQIALGKQPEWHTLSRRASMLLITIAVVLILIASIPAS
jgi:hypothetical protein